MASLWAFEDRKAPQIHFATCQQHFPENFWNPAFQRHANSAVGIAGIVAVAEHPEGHSRFFEVFAGVSPIAIAGGFEIRTPRGTIEIVTPENFTHRFGVNAPDVSRGPRLAALRFGVADTSLLEAVPEQAGIAGIFAGNPTVVGPDDAMGATLIFEPVVREAR